MNVNKVVLVGRITKAPEVRMTPSNQSVTQFSIATNQYWTDKSGNKQERTEFHNIVLWGRLAEIAGKYLMKGQEVYVEGRLQTREYESKDSIKRRVTEIIGENIQMGSRPANSQGQASVQTSAPAKEEIPTINLDDDKEEVKIEDVPF